MNVLADILCDTTSLLAPPNYKVSSENKLIPAQDMFSRSGSLNILDSTSQIPAMERPLPPINSHSSPSSIDLFNSTSQIHISQTVDTDFEDRSESLFSDPFAEIVPSWLTHDFMKVSDNLPSPSILSNVSDIYSTAQEDEHLEMLDLGFTPDLTSHDLTGNDLNRTCIDDSQKLLSDIPMQRFSGHEPLLLSSLSDISVSDLHLPVKNNINFEKNMRFEKNMNFEKFKHPADIRNTSNLMSNVLNCNNDLVHLPIHSSIGSQCLTTTSSPTFMHSSQSHNTVSSVCDKLPPINLTLNSLIGSNISDMQLLHQEFPSVNLSGAMNHSNRNLNECVPIVNETTNSLVRNNIAPYPKTCDASVQVTSKGLVESENCLSCCKIGMETAIEITQCYKCKFCNFISLHKCYLQNHITNVHSTPFSVANGTNLLTSNAINPPLCTTNSTDGNYINSDGIVSSSSVVSLNSHLSDSLLSSASTYVPSDNPVMSKSNFVSGQNVNATPVQISISESVPLSYQLIPISGVVLSSSGKNESSNATVNDNSQFVPESLANNINSKHRPILKKPEDLDKKTSESKKSLPKSNRDEIVTEKSISAQKKGWRKKIRRELGSYICEFKGCNVRFKALDNLEYHRKCHVSGGNAFACPECGIAFNNWSSIAGHLWRNHSNDMELHACDVCPFRTFSLSRLENYHKKTHLDECLFLCDTCGKKFKNRKQLRNHRVIHNKNRVVPSQKSFKCKICLSNFTSKSLLHSHQDLVHNLKRKNFQCSYCDFTTYKKANMDMHVRQHTGEKPFQCDECEYKTSDHNSLRRHKMIHSGEKSYKCPFCPYSSIQANTYKDHLKRKHPGQDLIYSCKQCTFRTLKSETFNKHMEEHESISKHKQLHQLIDMNSNEEMFSLAEAMGIRLTNSDNLTYMNNGTNQSFVNNINMNMMQLCQGNTV